MDKKEYVEDKTMSEIELILLNLKMLSKIKQYDKIYVDEQIIKIDKPSFSRSINRWYKDYSRAQSMDDIDNLAKDTESYISNIFIKKDPSNEENRNCQNILSEISMVIIGLQNLKITYNSDTFIQSRLDVIQDKFSVCKNKLSSHLKVIE